MDQKEGGKAVFGFGNRSTIFEMKITKLLPYKSIHWICVSGNADEWINTTQQFEIGEPNEEKVVDVKFSHAGWESDKGYCYLCNTTWGHLMVNLKSYIEEGISCPYFT